MTSLPRIVLKLCQVSGWIEFLMKWTEPSANAVLTPPGWRLLAAYTSVSAGEVATQGGFGGRFSQKSGSDRTSGNRLLGVM